MVAHERNGAEDAVVSFEEERGTPGAMNPCAMLWLKGRRWEAAGDRRYLTIGKGHQYGSSTTIAADRLRGWGC